MNTFLKSMILPMAASALLIGTAANAQVPAPKPDMSAESESAGQFGNGMTAPVILVDDDHEGEGHQKHGKKRLRLWGDDEGQSDGDNDHEDGEDDDDDGEGGANAGGQQMNGPVPDNGLFNNGTKPTVEVQ